MKGGFGREARQGGDTSPPRQTPTFDRGTAHRQPTAGPHKPREKPPRLGSPPPPGENPARGRWVRTVIGSPRGPRPIIGGPGGSGEGVTPTPVPPAGSAYRFLSIHRQPETHRSPRNRYNPENRPCRQRGGGLPPRPQGRRLARKSRPPRNRPVRPHPLARAHLPPRGTPPPNGAWQLLQFGTGANGQRITSVCRPPQPQPRSIRKPPISPIFSRETPWLRLDVRLCGCRPSEAVLVPLTRHLLRSP